MKKNTDKKKFLILSSKLFLTYKYCNEISSKTILHKHFINYFKNKNSNIIALITSYENSDNEHNYKHFHVFIKLDRKLRISNPNALDINGIHGEYQSVRHEKNTITYITKDKDFLIDGDEAVILKTSTLSDIQLLQFIVNKIYQLKTWKCFKMYHYLSFHESLNKAITFLKLEDRFKYFLKSKKFNQSIQLAISHEHPNLFKVQRFSLKEFDVPKQINEWYHGPEKHLKTLIVLGPSGLGKTELSKALSKNPLLISHIDQLKELKIGKHDCIIFDDMNFAHWPRESFIHLTDLANDRGINVKGDYATIPAGLKRIITSNKNLHEIIPNWFDEAINRRIFIVEVGMKLLFKTTEWR